MIVSLIAIGSRGDVAPLITLGQGLAKRGHEVRVLAHGEFAPLAAGSDVTFLSARGKNPRELLDGPKGRAFLRAARTPRGYAKRFAELASDAVEIGFEDTLAAADGSDVILYQPTAFGGFNVAEKLGIPAVQVQLQPFLRSRSYPSVFVPRRTLGALGNSVSHVMAERMLSYALREPLNRARAKVLGLPPLTSKNTAGDRVKLDAGQLLGFSAHVVPPAPDWPPSACQCGFWMDVPESNWSPDAATAAFLARSGATLLFTLGSMVVDDPQKLVEAVVEAAAASGHKLLFQRGWAGFGEGVSASHVHMIDEAPHTSLFPLVDAVIHHGGAGTTARVLAAGLPSFAVPVIADQWFWGYRIAALGAGPAPLSADNVSVKALTKRFSTLITKNSYRQRAGAVGMRLQSEDAISPTVDALERIVAQGAPATA